MKFRCIPYLGVAVLASCFHEVIPRALADSTESPQAVVVKLNKDAIRIATFNVSLYRKQLGQLAKDLEAGDRQAEQLAKIIRRVNPDIILFNEIDDDGGKSARLFRDRYLHAGGIDKTPQAWPFIFTPSVNTGVDSGLDLDGNDKLGTAVDCWGYGEYPGQYGLAVLSRYPIDETQVRTFQKFLWSEMPMAMRPENVDGSYYWSDSIWKQLRLSSKTHADVVVNVDGERLHLLVSHPTPPVFDGPEDRNGYRNHDEIRFWKDYVESSTEGYHVDDAGTKGGLAEQSCFVILGDLNADPIDGSGIHEVIQGLLTSQQVNSRVTPRSDGAVEAAKVQGKQNVTHKADAANDTGDFNDGNPGNLRCDFVLPSADLSVVDSGVYWPSSKGLSPDDKKMMDATDHRIVWIDVVLPSETTSR